MAKPSFRLTQPVVREHPLQEALTRVLKLEIAPPGKLSMQGVCWYSIDHANYHGEVPGTRTARGVVSGLPDTWFHWTGRTGCIELKATDGYLSNSQMERMPVLAQAGVLVAVANDEWQVLQVLDFWGVPRARRVRVSA